MKTLYPEQAVSIDYLKASLKQWNGALDSSETGTGKTLKAVELSRQLGLKAVVICPKSTIPAWERTFVEQGVDFYLVTNYEKIKTGKTKWLKKHGRGFVWNCPADTLMVFDEVHRCKAPYSQNSKMLMAADRFPTLMLSATAAENPAEMRSIGYILRLHQINNYAQFALKYGATFNPWGALEFDLIDGPPKLKILNTLLYPNRAHKLTRKDLGDHFKQTSISYDPIDFNDKGKIKAILAEVENELMRLVDKQREDRSRAAENDTDVMAITKILRARQRVELLKIPVIEDMVDDYLSQNHAVAVFLNFNDSVDALRDRLKVPHGVIRGGQSARERQQAIDDFQQNKTRVIIANLAAGGVGVSLHDELGGHPRVALISPSYSAKDLQQCLGRVDRAGSQSDSVQKILIATDTIEETVLAKIRSKLNNLEILHQYEEPNMKKKQPTNTTIETTNTSFEAVLQTPIPEKHATTAQPAQDSPAHAEFSPSQLKNFRACPGFAPSGGTSDAAESGTRIHEALETGSFDKLTEFEEYIAGLCGDAVEKILGNAGFDLSKGDVKDIREIRVDIACGDESTFGTCDRLFIKGNKAIAMDYKTGVSKIDDAEDNMQAKAYTVGIFQQFPEIDTLDFWFIVPRRDELLFASFTRDNVAEIQQEIANTIRKARKAKECWTKGEISVDMLSASPDHCRWCANAHRCPAVASTAIKVVERYAEEPLTLPEIVHGSEINNPETISNLLKLAPILEKCISGWKNRAREMAFEEGLDIPGFERAERGGIRKITNPVAAWDRVKDMMSIEQFLAALGDISAAKFEDAVGSTAPRGKKKELISTVMSDLFADGSVHVSNGSQFLRATHE